MACKQGLRLSSAEQVIVDTNTSEYFEMAQAMASSAVAAAGSVAASRTCKACSSPVATPRPVQLRRSVLHGQTLRAVAHQCSRSRISTLCRVRVHLLCSICMHRTAVWLGLTEILIKHYLQAARISRFTTQVVSIPLHFCSI